MAKRINSGIRALVDKLLQRVRIATKLHFFLAAQLFDFEFYFRCQASAANFAIQNKLGRRSTSEIFCASCVAVVLNKSPNDIR